MRYAFALASAAALTSVASAKDVPQNLKDLISSVTQQGQCNDPLSGGLHTTDNDANDTVYCGDHLDDYGIMYLQGTNGALSNMDIDCDGNHDVADDGTCDGSGDTQSETSFGEDVPGLGYLNPYVHTYTVFGNVGENDDGSSNVPGYTVFQPDQHGIAPLSIMAVVCNDKLFYGVWGDENGDDDNEALVGEAAISLAKMCCPQDDPSADQGCNGNDFMYIAFTGDDAVPQDADWGAQSAEDFEASLQTLGDKLVSRIGSSGSAPPTTTSASAPSSTPTSGTCSWEGHCQGATCSSDDDCSDSLTCSSGTCN